MSDKILVIYKSGAQVTLTCEGGFVVEKRGGTLESVTWNGKTTPRPLFFGIDDVEAIYEVTK